jgi:hypothetical protein
VYLHVYINHIDEKNFPKNHLADSGDLKYTIHREYSSRKSLITMCSFQALTDFRALLNPYGGRFAHGKGLPSVLEVVYLKLLRKGDPPTTEELQKAIEYLQGLSQNTRSNITKTEQMLTRSILQLKMPCSRRERLELPRAILEVTRSKQVYSRDIDLYQSLIRQLQKLQKPHEQTSERELATV